MLIRVLYSLYLHNLGMQGMVSIEFGLSPKFLGKIYDILVKKNTPTPTGPKFLSLTWPDQKILLNVSWSQTGFGPVWFGETWGFGLPRRSYPQVNSARITYELFNTAADPLVDRLRVHTKSVLSFMCYLFSCWPSGRLTTCTHQACVIIHVLFVTAADPLVDRLRVHTKSVLSFMCYLFSCWPSGRLTTCTHQACVIIHVLSITAADPLVDRLRVHTKPVLAVAADSQYIISASEDQTIAVHDRRTTNKLVKKIKVIITIHTCML